MADRTFRATKIMLPGEAQTYRAYRETKRVVQDAAAAHLGDAKVSEGKRPASARERIQEWDNLSAEQRNAIIDKMGMQWYISQAEEIQRLREALAEIPPLPNLPGGP